MLERKLIKKRIIFLFSAVMLTGMGIAPVERPIDINEWETGNDRDCQIQVKQGIKNDEKITAMRYRLNPDFGWVELKTNKLRLAHLEQPISFKIKADAPSDLEIKFIDHDGSVFGKKIKLKNKFEKWEEIVINLKNMDYWWGGDNKLNNIAYLAFAVSGTGNGKMFLKDFKTEKMDKPLTFRTAGPQLDPNRHKSGWGFEQRRTRELVSENEKVLEYLKVLQDTASPEKQLVPSQEGFQAQTFNNALVAVAFILKGEQERAERILDFYATAMNEANTDPTLQNFYYKGEARGFFQQVAIKRDKQVPAYHHWGDADRWMGDMAWLWLAYHYYGKVIDNEKYQHINEGILELLRDWYKEDPKGGGYIQHGWRKGDQKLHEANGHHEGNIDCYAVFNAYGDHETANNIKKWLDRELKDLVNLPLDLYAWRTLAFGSTPHLLDIPEHDFRYRKIIALDDEKTIMGFYHSADIEANNLWLDGLGHMACAYYTVGNQARGNFYANQMDTVLINRNIAGKKVKAMPYTINNNSGYDWVNISKGFASTCAWYIFAKNKFNPMTLKQYK